MQAVTGRPADSCHPGTRATRASHPNLFQTDLSLVTFFWPRKRQIRQELIWSALADPKGEVQGWASQRNSPSGAINPIK
jgi:hypothetical protein